MVEAATNTNKNTSRDFFTDKLLNINVNINISTKGNPEGIVKLIF
jgi:hypothetical protein